MRDDNGRVVHWPHVTSGPPSSDIHGPPKGEQSPYTHRNCIQHSAGKLTLNYCRFFTSMTSNYKLHMQPFTVYDSYYSHLMAPPLWLHSFQRSTVNSRDTWPLRVFYLYALIDEMSATLCNICLITSQWQATDRSVRITSSPQVSK